MYLSGPGSRAGSAVPAHPVPLPLLPLTLHAILHTQYTDTGAEGRHGHVDNFWYSLRDCVSYVKVRRGKYCCLWRQW